MTLNLTANAEEKKNDIWTLENSLKRLFEENEIIKAFSGSTESIKALITSGRMPNPEIEIGATNEFSVQKGKRGYDYNTISISQKFPLAELFYGKDVRKANYKKSLSDKDDLILKLNLEFSLIFRELQYKKGLLDLANNELILLKKQISDKKQKVVRFQSPLDKTKMELIINEGFINMKKIEEEIHELEAKIKTFLNISEKNEFNVSSIQKLKNIGHQISKSPSHPAVNSLVAEKYSIEKQITKEKTNRFGEVELTAFNQQEFIFNKPTSTNGALIKFSIPLWSWRGSKINSLKHKKTEISYRLNSIKRIYKSEQQIIFKHYKHQLNLQGFILSTQIPKAKIFLDKTIKSYAVGQTNILSLIDAYQGYFGAKKTLLELLHGGWREYEELRYLTNNFQKIGGTK
jgi:hypothetical protein